MLTANRTTDDGWGHLLRNAAFSHPPCGRGAGGGAVPFYRISYEVYCNSKLKRPPHVRVNRHAARRHIHDKTKTCETRGESSKLHGSNTNSHQVHPAPAHDDTPSSAKPFNYIQAQTSRRKRCHRRLLTTDGRRTMQSGSHTPSDRVDGQYGLTKATTRLNGRRGEHP